MGKVTWVDFIYLMVLAGWLGGLVSHSGMSWCQDSKGMVLGGTIGGASERVLLGSML